MAQGKQSAADPVRAEILGASDLVLAGEVAPGTLRLLGPLSFLDATLGAVSGLFAVLFGAPLLFGALWALGTAWMSAKMFPERTELCVLADIRRVRALHADPDFRAAVEEIENHLASGGEGDRLPLLS